LIKHNESESNAVLRTMIDGLPLTEKGFERSYGVGVRNSFGLTFDPLTGYLWEIEEGPGTLGKVNLIRPDLNSDSNDDFKLPQNASILWDVNGCHYINCPKFVRPNFSSVSALIFMNSSALGKEYTNDLFVGDMDGNIYHFDLDRNRKNIVIKDNLSDHIFATGFGSVSDLKIGPDDALYVLAIASNTSFPSEKDGGGMIYRIANNTIALPFLDSRAISADHLGLVVLAIIIIIILVSLTFLKKYSRKDSKPRRRFYIRRLWVL